MAWVRLTRCWHLKVRRVRTPPVSPKILSRSGGVRTSLPTTDFLKPGAYFSTQSNAAQTCTHAGSQTHLVVTDVGSSVRFFNVLLLADRIFIYCSNCTFKFCVSTSRLLCFSLACICVGFPVLISPLLALDVEGRELSEQQYHVAARGSQSGIQHRGNGHLQHGPENTIRYDKSYVQVKVVLR